MNKKQPKRIYLVKHPGCPDITIDRPTPQAACRKAFRVWVKDGHLNRQPKSDDMGGFENVEVEILR